jgi:NTP pyrophosphatase (non-canonical NTP hydrolase)
MTDNYPDPIYLESLSVLIHETAVEKGFWRGSGVDFILSKIALIHSEGSEVLEAIRKQKGSREIVEEISDILIRTLDLYEGLIDNKFIDREADDLDLVIREKMEKNKSRPHMHGVLA